MAKHDDIRMAQVRAGERAVLERLRAKGLAESDLDRQANTRARRILRYLAFAMTPEEERRLQAFIEGEIKEAVRQVLDETLGRPRRVF